MKNLNILIIDDHEIIAEGVNTRIKKILPDANCFFAENSRIALMKLNEKRIDLIICDLSFRNDIERDGFYIIKHILGFEPKIKSIAYTSFDSYRVMKKAIESGFDSFLDKGCTFKEFSDTITNVLKKNGIYESEIMKKLKSKREVFVRSVFSDSQYGFYNLSERELELVINCANTTDKEELGKLMNISPHTIDTHFKHVLEKLNLKHRKEVALFSMEFTDELLQMIKQK